MRSVPEAQVWDICIGGLFGIFTCNDVRRGVCLRRQRDFPRLALSDLSAPLGGSRRRSAALGAMKWNVDYTDQCLRRGAAQGPHGYLRSRRSVRELFFFY